MRSPATGTMPSSEWSRLGCSGTGLERQGSTGGWSAIINGYGSIPINTIFRGMNIHLPAILMFTRGTRLWHTAIYTILYHSYCSYEPTYDSYPSSGPWEEQQSPLTASLPESSQISLDLSALVGVVLFPLLRGVLANDLVHVVSGTTIGFQRIRFMVNLWLSGTTWTRSARTSTKTAGA